MSPFLAQRAVWPITCSFGTNAGFWFALIETHPAWDIMLVRDSTSWCLTRCHLYGSIFMIIWKVIYILYIKMFLCDGKSNDHPSLFSFIMNMHKQDYLIYWAWREIIISGYTHFVMCSVWCNQVTLFCVFQCILELVCLWAWVVWNK